MQYFLIDSRSHLSSAKPFIFSCCRPAFCHLCDVLTSRISGSAWSFFCSGEPTDLADVAFAVYGRCYRCSERLGVVVHCVSRHGVSVQVPRTCGSGPGGWPAFIPNPGALGPESRRLRACLLLWRCRVLYCCVQAEAKGRGNGLELFLSTGRRFAQDSVSSQPISAERGRTQYFLLQIPSRSDVGIPLFCCSSVVRVAVLDVSFR